jgi:hypothetical protein
VSPKTALEFGCLSQDLKRRPNSKEKGREVRQMPETNSSSAKLALARRNVPKLRCIVGRSGHYPSAVGAKLRRIDGVFVLHRLA